MSPDQRQGEAMKPSEGLLHEYLFEQAPILGALLDDRLQVVDANERFRRIFPDWEGRHCFELLFGREAPCSNCHALRALADGRTRVTEVCLPLGNGTEMGIVTRVAPLKGSSGGRRHLIWLGSAVDEVESLQRENEILFEHVPGFVAVLDRQLRIVRANQRLREAFGARRGQFCYAVYKRRDRPCDGCPALLAFADGREHTAPQVRLDAHGRETPCLMTAAPLLVAGGVAGDEHAHYVIETSIILGADACTHPGRDD
jgi:PAS domain-containing protein